MLFVVRFTEKPESQAVRKEFLSAHLEWLERHAAEVLVAGSLRSEAEGPAVGALWIVEAPSREAVEALMKESGAGHATPGELRRSQAGSARPAAALMHEQFEAIHPFL